MASAVAPKPSPTERGVGVPLIAAAVLALLGGLLLPYYLAADAPVAVQTSKDTQSTAKTGYSPTPWPEPLDHRAVLTRLAIGTGFVLALCVVTLWLGRRWLVGAAPRPAGSAEMRLVETLHLGNRCSLHLVQLASRQVLVGADAGGVRSIVPLPESFDGYLAEADATPPERAAAP